MKTILMISCLLTTSAAIAQTGIGTVAPDASAELHVSSAHKGILLPNVALTSATDVVTVPNPAVGLLVWNTGAGGLIPAGYYYNRGTVSSPQWLLVANFSDANTAYIRNGTTTQASSNFNISGSGTIGSLANTANRAVHADANGTLNKNTPTYKLSSDLHPSYDDISGWTDILNGTCQDDNAYTVNWGFNFKIDGVNYTSGWISTNGILGFGTNSTTSLFNGALPTGISNDPMLFFHWDDLRSNLIRYIVLGSAPNRVCYIYGRFSPFSSAPCSTNTNEQFQVYIELHEGSNLLSVRYVQVGTNANVRGTSTTFGFQFAGGSSAYNVPLGYNAPILDDNNPGQTFSLDFGQ